MSETPEGAPTDLFQTVFWSTKRAMWEASDAANRKHGVREGQQFILKLLWEEDGLTPGDLARRLGLATPTVTKAATRMEAAGILTRKPDARDRRLVRLYLTTHGKSLEKILDAEMAVLSERALAGLDDNQRGELIKTLTQIRENLLKDSG